MIIIIIIIHNIEVYFTFKQIILAHCILLIFILSLTPGDTTHRRLAPKS